ncbi:MAG: nucleoside-triphosphatase [Marinifilaceae bacterium]
MVRKKKNLFITGAPSSGKTTIIKRVIDKLEVPANGFYTEEEKVEGRRVGFMMKTLDGQKAYLAHEDIKSVAQIRRYGVSITDIEGLAVPAIKPVGENIIILDEIGKMECFSSLFLQATIDALDAPNIVLGTITFGGDEFIQGVKNREDVEIIEITPENREQLPDILLEKIGKLLESNL